MIWLKGCSFPQIDTLGELQSVYIRPILNIFSEISANLGKKGIGCDLSTR